MSKSGERTRLCLVTIAAVLSIAGLAACGDDETTTVTETEATTVTEQNTEPATTSSAGGTPVQFQAPSGNIGCAISAEFVNCSIVEADWTPPGEPSCPPEAGRFIAFEGDEPQFQCGSPEPPIGDALPYGESVTRGSFTCQSASDGLTCENGGHGFFLSRQGQETH